MPLRVEIPRCAAQEDPDNESKQHTVYTIFCSKGKHGWMVQRRYTQFRQLHEQLTAVGLVGLPELPPKKLMGNMAAEFVEQRRLGLESYLQQVCTVAGAQGADAGKRAVLKPLYTFVGADWLLDEDGQDTLDGWVRQPLPPRTPRPTIAPVDEFAAPNSTVTLHRAETPDPCRCIALGCRRVAAPPRS